MQLCFDNAGHFAVPASVQFEAGARLSPTPPHSTPSLYHSCLMDMNLIPIIKHAKPKEINRVLWQEGEAKCYSSR